ncbi:helicase associated domain-containing protein [Streptomyces violascens]|uniref:helicase associated domain-containing protein n=1 Tax=Streptomyces violascens TaxID=67381 RepID=UPI003668FDE9
MPYEHLERAYPLGRWLSDQRRALRAGQMPSERADDTAGAAAFGAYAWGVMSGFYILDPDQMCAARGAQGDHIVTREMLPVSAQCVTPEGVGTELVPDWVNPVILMGLTLLTLALVTGTVAGVRQRLSRRDTRSAFAN